MSDDTTVDTDGGTDTSDHGPTFARREALALLGTSAVAGVANTATATRSTDGTSSPVEWERDRDARGHDLADAATVEANAVTVEELGGDPSGGFGSVTVDNANLDRVHTGAREADRVVWTDESGTFHADGPDGQVASGEDLLRVTQSAVDSLAPDRTWKESVLVTASGTVSATDSSRAIDLPSYTVLDVPGTLRFESPDDVAVRIQESNHVEVPRLNVTGSPSSAVLVRACSDVDLGRLDLQFAADGESGVAVRIDDGLIHEADDATIGRTSEDGTRTTDVRIGSAYVENCGGHAIETMGVLRCRIGNVVATDHAGCAVLLNATFDSTVGSVVGHNPDVTGSYGTFRCANGCENVTVGRVVSRNAPRGVHLITNSDEVTIGEVTITGARDHGIKVDRTVDDVVLQGGLVRNVTPTAVLIQGGGVSVTNFRVVDDRPEHDRTQTHGIHVTSTARDCRVVNNDVRRAGIEADIRIDAPADDVRPNTTVRDNVGDGIASGSVVLQSEASPAARVEGVTDRKDVTLDLRGSTVRGPADGRPFNWEGYFEWNGDTARWDLVLEWETDPLENVEVEYVVDQPLANLGRVSRQIDNDRTDAAP